MLGKATRWQKRLQMLLNVTNNNYEKMNGETENRGSFWAEDDRGLKEELRKMPIRQSWQRLGEMVIRVNVAHLGMDRFWRGTHPVPPNHRRPSPSQYCARCAPDAASETHRTDSQHSAPNCNISSSDPQRITPYSASRGRLGPHIRYYGMRTGAQW